MTISKLKLNACLMLLASLLKGTAAESCGPGRYVTGWSWGFQVCGDCPAGKYQGSWDQGSCNICPPGTFSEGRASSCTVCSPGRYNEVEGATSAASCQVCGYGGYCSGGARYKCPPMTFNGAYDEAGSESICKTCPPGKWSGTGSKTCLTCPKGIICLDGAMSTCGEGFFSVVEGSITRDDCQKCPVGRFSQAVYATVNAGDLCYIIADRFAITLNLLLQLNPGLDCMMLQIGQRLKVSTASNSCEVCPPGFLNDAEGSSGCPIECPPNSFCVNGVKTPCQDGYTSTPGSSSECTTLCPEGWQCKDGAMTFCDPGQWSGPGSSTCDPDTCPQGEYCKNGEHLKCPAGTWSDSMSLSAVEGCNKCPMGKYAANAGGTDASVCINCPAGYWTNNPGSVSCTNVPCGPGFYCPGQGNREACPAGTSSAATTAKAETTCAACPNGKWSSKDLIPGSPGLPPHDCSRDCPAGFYCASKKKTPCPQGTWSSTLGASSETTCQSCPAGKTSNKLGAASADECQNCDPGKYIVNNICNAVCPIGTYCVQGEAMSCPAGTSTLGTGSSSVAACVKCKEGQFSLAGGACQPCPDGMTSSEGTANECTTPCPVGSYCVGGVKTVCTAGNYMTVKSGAASASDCTQCVPGSYCPDGINKIVCPDGKWSASGAAADCSVECEYGAYCVSGVKTVCAAGNYMTKLQGGSSSNDCKKCPPGSKCPNGKVSEVCPDGKWSSEGSVTCDLDCEYGAYCVGGVKTVCSKGSYMTKQIGSSSASDCKKCAPGSKCPDGKASVPCEDGKWSYEGNEACDLECEYGSYCTGGKITSCASGYYMKKLQGGSSPNDCIKCFPGVKCPNGKAYEVCPDGKWSSEGSATCDLDCEYGSYCLQGNKASCAPGYFMEKMLGASSPSDCKNCPAGSYCPDGKASKPCPDGKWSSEANPVCSIECEAGAYCVGGVKTVCTKGNYMTKAEGGSSASDCKPCAKGNYCLDGKTFKACPDGETTEKEGADSSTLCKKKNMSDTFNDLKNDVLGSGASVSTTTGLNIFICFVVALCMGFQQA